MTLDNKYKMTIAYDGTHYGGWQIQINTLSIQALIEQALSTLLRKPTRVIASGRTDAGVHALGQVAHFSHADSIDAYKILYALNALLPPDIRILSLEHVPTNFHARFSAISKTYHYYLHLDSLFDPFQRLYTYRPPVKIDIDLLKEAAQHFTGTHDFTSFANVRTPVPKNGNIRTIHSLKVLEKEPLWTQAMRAEKSKTICLAFEGNGFLYKMVRNIMGALLDVCAKRLSIADIPRIFAAKDRRAAGIAAPAQGLFLMEVNYAELQRTPHACLRESNTREHACDEQDK